MAIAVSYPVRLPPCRGDRNVRYPPRGWDSGIMENSFDNPWSKSFLGTVCNVSQGNRDKPIVASLINTEWRIYAPVNYTIICSANGLSPIRCQAIIWTNAGILLTGPLELNFSEMLIEIHTFSFKKMHFKMSSVKGRPFCLGLNVPRGDMDLCLCQNCFR